MEEKTFENSQAYELILGSASPRRNELMQHTYLPFTVDIADLAENSLFEKPVEVVQDLALQKARQVFSQQSSQQSSDRNNFVIGADTIVVINDKILGKPEDRLDAQNMLELLSGKTHQVYTGVAFCWKQNENAVNEHTFYDCTEVEFENISKDLMQFYLDTQESLDKAGSYGIQGAALGFIKKIHGSYSNVVGLPVDKLIHHLKIVLNAGDDMKGDWRKCFTKPHA